MDKRKAFQAQSSECILLGYVEDAKAYKLLEHTTRNCFIEHIVQFEEYQLCDPPPSKAQEGITTLPLHFDDDDLLYVLDSDEEDQIQHDLVIEAEPHEILDPDPTPIPKQRPNPRWTQQLGVTAGDGVENPEDRRRTGS